MHGTVFPKNPTVDPTSLWLSGGHQAGTRCVDGDPWQSQTALFMALVVPSMLGQGSPREVVVCPLTVLSLQGALENVTDDRGQNPFSLLMGKAAQ